MDGFFPAVAQCALDGPRMHRDGEASLHQFGELRAAEGVVTISRICDERHNVLRELVSSSRAALLRDQPWESFVGHRTPHVVEGRTGDPKRRRRVADTVPLGLGTSQHLVLHLHHVPQVKEAPTLKEGITDL